MESSSSTQLPALLNYSSLQRNTLSVTTTKTDVVIDQDASLIRLVAGSGISFVKFGESVQTATTSSWDYVLTEGMVLDLGVVNRHMSIISDSTATLYYSTYS